MHKLIRLLKRPAGTDPERFQAEWLDQAIAALPALGGLEGYVLNLCLPGAYRKMEPVFDGYAEEYYASKEALAMRCGMADSPIGMENHARATLLPVTVAVLHDGGVPPDAIKSLELIRRRPDLTHSQFDRYWEEQHGPLACAVPFLRYEQNHLTPDAADRPDISFHGAAITWFDSIADMRTAALTEAYRDIRADERNFLDGISPVLLTTARVLLSGNCTPVI